MKSADRIALIYGASILGVGGLYYWKGERDLTTLAGHAFKLGLIVGTGANVIAWMAADHEAHLNPARKEDDGPSGVGRMAVEGVKLLGQVNPDHFYKAARMAGLHIGPEGDNPSIVDLPEEE